ncbi:MAG: GNAT family N-acetyltransferase [Syntrophales bacterium]|nr:GNAT family N-acetyltransferase [Syntrophales bacterium]
MRIHISSNRESLRIDDIQSMLSNVFWSPNITKNEILKGIRNSALVVGAYTEDGQQIGFLRVVSDKVRFAYILDAVVREDHRKQGLGQKMVKFALSHPQMRDVYQWVLKTLDAHGVYEKCGFEPLQYQERWMSIIKPRPERVEFAG